jgi:putative MATE family efflux protein
MKTGVPSHKRIWEITFPIILTLIAQNVINVTDTAFLGRVGEVELGASALAGIFYIAIFMLGYGFSTGTQIMIARRNGEKSFAQVGQIFDQANYFFVALAVLVFGLIYFFGTPFLKLVVSSEKILGASEIYLKTRVFGVLFAFGNLAFRALLVGIAQTKALGYSAFVMAITNVILDYLFIFGHYGFPAMGIGGAALASVFSELLALIFFIVYTFSKLDRKQYPIFQFPKVDYTLIGKTLELSIYVMAQYFISILTWFTFFAFIEQMGERPLAISNIIRSIYMVLMIPVMALSTATNTLVSNAIGAGFKEDVVQIINKTVMWGVFIALPVIASMLLIPETMVSIYTGSQALIDATIPSVYTISGAVFLFAIAFISFSGVSGTANTKTALFIEVLTLVIYIGYVYWITQIKQAPVHLAWTSEYVYMAFLGIFSYLYLYSGRWKQKEI